MQSAVVNAFGTTASGIYPTSVAAGDLLIAAVRLGNATGVATVSDNNGNPWQRVDRRADTGGDDLELWYAPNAAAAPNAQPTLTIASSVSATIRVVMAEYSGVLASGPLDQHATAAGVSAAPLVSSASTAQAVELVIGYGEVENNSTFAAGPAETLDAGHGGGTGGKLAPSTRCR